MPGPEIIKRAERLLEETRESINTQERIIASLERRELDATIARKVLAELEEALVRRTEILSQLRAKVQEKRDRK